jgi:hypothetical protein
MCTMWKVFIDDLSHLRFGYNSSNHVKVKYVVRATCHVMYMQTLQAPPSPPHLDSYTTLFMDKGTLKTNP